MTGNRNCALDVATVLAEIPSGRWTTHGEVAVVVGSHPVPVGQAIANHTMPNPWRVLNAGGTLSAQFRWTDQHRTDDPRDLLRAEGVDVDVAGRADPEQFMDAVELAAGMGLDIDASTLRRRRRRQARQPQILGAWASSRPRFGRRCSSGAANMPRTLSSTDRQDADTGPTASFVSVPATSGTPDRLTDWCSGSYGPPMTSFESSMHSAPDRRCNRHDWAHVGHEILGSGHAKTPCPSGRGFFVVGLTGLEIDH